MNRLTALSALLLTGCGPVFVEFDDVDDDSNAAEDGKFPWVGGGDESPDDGDPDGEEEELEEEGDSEEEEEVEEVRVRSGEWSYRFEVEDDPCDWETVLQDAPDGIADFMPTEFAVDGREGSFDIEAIRYGGDFGTDGPVRCEVEGSTFSCEPQDVVPVDGFLGSYGWRYEVSFSGEVITDRIIRGTSRVDFPSVDSGTASALDSIGVSPLDCLQTISMRLQWEGELEG